MKLEQLLNTLNCVDVIVRVWDTNGDEFIEAPIVCEGNYFGWHMSDNTDLSDDQLESLRMLINGQFNSYVDSIDTLVVQERWSSHAQVIIDITRK